MTEPFLLSHTSVSSVDVLRDMSDELSPARFTDDKPLNHVVLFNAMF